MRFRLSEEERGGDTDLEPQPWQRDQVGDHVCLASAATSSVGVIARSLRVYDGGLTTAMAVVETKLLLNKVR